jgi:hypothetical protein
MGRSLERRRRTNIGKITQNAVLQSGRRGVANLSFQKHHSEFTVQEGESQSPSTEETVTAENFTEASGGIKMITVFKSSLPYEVMGKSKFPALDEV